MNEMSHSRALVPREDTPLPAVVTPPPVPGQDDRRDGDAGREPGREGAPGEGKGDHGTPKRDEAPPRPPRARTVLFALIPVVLLIGWGAWQHYQRSQRASVSQKQVVDFTPDVRTTHAKREDGPVDLVLPGQTESFDQADLFARATGYIAERRVDIGSRVHKGDLLVRIAAPDLDQQLVQAEAQLGQTQAQLLQAQASLEQAQANTKLANVTKFRETTLAAQGWETKQNADNSTANASVQQSNVDAAQAGVKVAEANFQAQMATVQRLKALTAFEDVVAPFDGVVTARNTDLGDLVSADANGGSPLFTVQGDNVLRISVQVPQSGAIGIHDNEAADVTVPELPSRNFRGTVSRSSVALTPNSRSLTAEVDVPNPDHTLRPGLYVNVTFHIPRQVPAIVVPADALVFNANGMQVATVDDDGTVHMHKVSIDRDFGQTVELNEGLQGGERIAEGLPAGIDDGGKVKIQDQQQPGQPNGDKQTAERGQGAG